MKKLNHKILLIFFVILSVVDVAVYYVCRSKLYFDFLNWNLFLAWVPLVFSSLVYLAFKRTAGKRRAFLMLLLGMAWLLFFPNSPYVVTDLIHLTVMKDIYADKGILTFAYWFDCIVILLFAWTSLLLGVISTYQIQYTLMKLSNKLLSWCFVMITSFAGGYGILLGREYRLNSWEAITDGSKVAEIIRASTTRNSLLFCLLFGLFIGIVYATVYLCINGVGKPEKQDRTYTI